MRRVNDGNDSYNWLALSARLWWTADDEEDRRAPWPMSHIDAYSGVFSSPPDQAANDLAALLFIYLLLLTWSYAKNSANLVNRCLVFCKLTPAEIFPRTPSEPLWIGAFLVLVEIPSQCQNDHLPTAAHSGFSANHHLPTLIPSDLFLAFHPKTFSCFLRKTTRHR